MKRCFMLATALASLLAVVSMARAQDQCAPGKVIDLAIDTGKTTAVAAFTMTGDDCLDGTAATIEIRCSTSPITDGNWASACVAYSGSAPSPGAVLCLQLDACTLNCNTTYYWAIKVVDDAGFVSPLSNVVQKATKSCGASPELWCRRVFDGNTGIPVLVRGNDRTVPVA